MKGWAGEVNPASVPVEAVCVTTMPCCLTSSQRKEVKRGCQGERPGGRQNRDRSPGESSEQIPGLRAGLRVGGETSAL